MTAERAAEREKVLVALDGSPAAATALPVARVIAAQLGATREALHVVAPQDGGALAVIPADLPDTLVQERVGEPAAVVLQASAEPGVVLVVITTHGRAIEPGRPLGRVAEAVIAGAARPIVLVRPEAAWTEARAAGLRRLLLPLDGAPSTAAALRPVTELAARLGAAVDILYVADPAQTPPRERGTITTPRYVDQPQHEWPQWAAEVSARLGALCAGCPPAVPIRVFLARGEVGGEVVQFAESHAEDAIALVRSSRFERGHAQALRTILDRTPCPIVLVGGARV